MEMLHRPGCLAASFRFLAAPAVLGLAAALVTLSARADDDASGCRQQDLFVCGQEGYFSYRIPALVVTEKGSLLAFCEGRRQSLDDSGQIELLLKRSADGGRTWNARQTVWNDGENTCGNPCPVVDRQTGTVWLLLTWNRGDDREPDIVRGTSKDTRRVVVCRSDDDGVTWSKPKEITAHVKRPSWTWYATGPGNGIQLTRGEHKGRLVVPCDHIEAETAKALSHVIYSDDHGKTWRLGGSSPADRTNECGVVELSDGRLMLNMRNHGELTPDEKSPDGCPLRAVCFSGDGGETWTDAVRDPALIEPACQASIFRYSWPENGRPGRILFSNPASATREKMTIRVSEDDGKTWPTARVLHAAGASYSSLAVLPDGSICCLYERGARGCAEKITLAVFTMDWLTSTQE